MTRPKILLIHGWNYANYTSSGCTNAWSNRSKFVQALSQHFSVVEVNLPGFCGQQDPEIPWTLDDYVDYVDKVIVKEKPEYILGYSFGGAIVLHWKNRINDNKVKAILVSPAILRKYVHSDLSVIQKIFKAVLPNSIISVLRGFYLIHVVKNPYYSRATKVMRETYRNIVTVDLKTDLLNVSDSLTLIYGENDSATPPVLVLDVIDHCMVHHDLHIIPGGGHDIANSHTDELVSLITKKGDE